MLVTPPLDMVGMTEQSLARATLDHGVVSIDVVRRGPNGWPTARFVGEKDQLISFLIEYSGDPIEAEYLLGECGPWPEGN